MQKVVLNTMECLPDFIDVMNKLVKDGYAMELDATPIVKHKLALKYKMERKLKRSCADAVIQCERSNLNGTEIQRSM